MMNFWYTSYFAHSSFHFLLVVFVFQVIYMKKSNYNLSLISGFMFLGSLTFGLLFYAQFKDHDYYFLTIMPFLILLLINGINTFKNISSEINHHRLVKAILFLIIVAGINYSRNKLNDRYLIEMNIYSQTGMLIDENRIVIDDLNIPKDAKIILAPEPSQNGGLLYINRMGWTILSLKEITKEKLIDLKSKGANYFVLASKDIRALEKVKTEGEVILESKDIFVLRLK